MTETLTPQRDVLLTTYEVEVTCTTRGQADAMANAIRTSWPRANVRISKRELVTYDGVACSLEIGAAASSARTKEEA